MTDTDSTATTSPGGADPTARNAAAPEPTASDAPAPDATAAAGRTVEFSGHWGEIDGVSIDFPVVVEDMNQLTLTFTVPLDAARDLIPGDGFEVMEVAPGSAMFVMAIVDYRKNPWGDYNEVNFGLMANPAGRPEAGGAFVYRMPVDQEFTSIAGNRVLGLPKTVEDLTFDYRAGGVGPEQVVVNLVMGGEQTLAVTFPRVTALDEPTLTDTVTFSYLDGRPTEVPLQIELGAGFVDPADVVIELGSSVVADELRGLGLPCAPDMALWGEGLRGTFLPPRPI